MKIIMEFCHLYYLGGAWLTLWTISLPFGNISLFNTSHSTEILPGPVSNSVIDIAINNKSSSYSPTNPFANLATSVEPIISIIKKIAAILVRTPKSNANPPITSSNPINIASSGSNP
jgi:hypothetical protein